MNDNIDQATFEFLVHMLEVSVVVGIGVIVYITNKHSKQINKDMEKRLQDELDISSEE
jgi:hypothetical protein